MKTIELKLQGPYSFISGNRCLFQADCGASSGVYLWTIENQNDHSHYIHYVGETGSFAKRQTEHLVNILGLNYGIWDPEKARHGIPEMIWQGFWRDKSGTGISRLLETYRELKDVVIEYLGILEVFFAEIDGETGLRRHIEGRIGWNLREKHPSVRIFYPDDCHIGGKRPKYGSCVKLVNSENILGLDELIEI